MLQFDYLPEPLLGPAPPSLPPESTSRWRPLVPVRISRVQGRSRFFPRAVLDPGADDTVFPIDVAVRLGIALKSHTGHVIRWRGQQYALRFGDVELELTDQNAARCRWPAVVGFSTAPLRYPILGNAGCLFFFDTVFRGENRVIEIQPAGTFPGTTA